MNWELWVFDEEAQFAFEAGTESRELALFSLKTDIARREDDTEGAYQRLLSFKARYNRELFEEQDGDQDFENHFPMASAYRKTLDTYHRRAALQRILTRKLKQGR